VDRGTTTEVHPDLSLWRDINPPSAQRLLLAALESFARLGFHGTTTRDIARSAQMSPAAMYLHYPSKAALLFEISHATHLAMLQELRAVFSEEALSPANRLANLARVQARFHANHHTAARVANYELNSLDPDHRETIVEVRRTTKRVMREAVRLGVQSGDFNVVDLEATTGAIISLAVDISRWYKPGGRLTADQIGELYADMAVRLVVTPL
jgi:AcrR family transcriptional regulator